MTRMKKSWSPVSFLKLQSINLCGSHLGSLLSLLVVSITPLFLTKALWGEVVAGQRPQAWDGTGHYALAQIYVQFGFPSTFGWTHAFFGGLPFPNFYPPLFYWLIALLDYTHLFSLPTAFKIVLVIPVSLVPAAIWMMAWKVTGKNWRAATAAALVILPLLVDQRFFNSTGLMGLNYPSTFLLGMYSQPLGFVLLIAWYVLYSSRRIFRLWGFALSSILLALALLANFFGATTAALLVVTTVAHDALKLIREDDAITRRQLWRTLAARAFSPIVAGCLASFWVAPLAASYDYFVTRPHSIPLNMLVPAVMWGWYGLAAAGVVIWLRRPTPQMWPYLATCLTLAGGVFFAAAFSPRWFPLHPPRLITTLNFLLAVPAGIAASAVLQQIFQRVWRRPSPQRQHSTSRIRSQRKQITNAGSLQSRPFGMIAVTILGSIGILIAVSWITPSDYSLAFYPDGHNERIDPVLRFAEHHRDGRYLVEVPPFSDVESALDARAINSYLGAQGNEAVSLFFREAAPNVLFFNPLVNALSTQPDAFGISSVLTADRDFAQQPLARHIERARFAGIRYLVMTTPTMKNRLDSEIAVEARHDLGPWSVFDIGKGAYQEGQLTGARTLAYQPALVIGDFSFKLRRREEYDFVRFAEEQFGDNWFDVLLARSPESRIDRLTSLDNFGAVVVDTYAYDDEARAFELLRDYAQRRKLVLLASDSSLFRRISDQIAQFPNAQIIDRPLGRARGEWIEADRPAFNYGTSAVRRAWREIQQALDQSKVEIPPAGVMSVKSEKTPLTISLAPNSTTAAPSEPVPVLVPTSYHPNWQRTDGETIYPATPFFMLTFIREPTQLIFARRPLDWAGLVASAVTLFLLIAYLLWCYGPSAARFVSHKTFAKAGSAPPPAVTSHARRSV